MLHVVAGQVEVSGMTCAISTSVSSNVCLEDGSKLPVDSNHGILQPGLSKLQVGPGNNLVDKGLDNTGYRLTYQFMHRPRQGIQTTKLFG